jgi:phosphoglycerol transferase
VTGPDTATPDTAPDAVPIADPITETHLDGPAVSAGSGDGVVPHPPTRPDSPTRRGRLGVWWRRSDLRWYLLALALTAAAVTWMMRLWRANLRIPFRYDSDALGHAAHFQTILETGWYEYQPRLGAPYGQHYHDYPFSDDLHMVMAKVLGWFTSDWVVAFNSYYLLTFLLCAISAVWFFRQCGLRPGWSVVLAVLFATAPYHFLRNEMHLFLSGYYLVPAGLVVVLWVARGEPVWRRRAGVNPVLGILTGRGAATVLVLGLLVYSGVYYAVFVGLLLVAAGLLSLARTRDKRRFGGAVMAGLILLGWYLLALLPDLLYSMANGSNSDALVRVPSDAQFYALRFGQLVMPAAGHPWSVLADLRAWYDDRYPPEAEQPALGLIATIGFLLLLAIGLAAIARSRRRGPELTRTATTFDQLSALTWTAFLLSTSGGLGLFVSMAVVPIRDWNRMSIVIGLLALAGFGLVIQSLQARWVRRAGLRRPVLRRVVRSAVPAVLVLVIGVADQSLDGAVPEYAEVAATFGSDQAFFGALEAQLPDGAMVFQVPFRDYPESAIINDTRESDQLRPFLNTTTLRWSAGGIKGRPQVDWAKDVANQPAERMTRELAVIGFVGIVVDREATTDHGRSWEYDLMPYTGPPTSISPDGRWAYYSLARVGLEVRTTMSPATREAITETITGVTPGAPN